MVRALASHRCGPGSIPGPGVTCGLSLLLVLVLARRVFLRVLRFSSLHKNQHAKFQFDLETLTVDVEPPRGSATALPNQEVGGQGKIRHRQSQLGKNTAKNVTTMRSKRSTRNMHAPEEWESANSPS